ncbi:ATP-binding cassette domain-containing protein [Thermococcus sp.]
MIVVETEDLSFKYRRAREYAIKNINLKVRKGEFLGILGASGSGKSTLCLTLNGIIPNSINGKFEGNVYVKGVSTREVSPAKLSTTVGLVLQNPESQLFNMTVEEEIAFGLENLGIEADEIRRRINWALKITGLQGLENEFPPNLSGGQKQRLAIASVLAMRPEIIVLDEPTAQLDPLGREQVLSLITLLNKEQGITIILVEHNTDYMLSFADRVIVMDRGEIIMEGKPEEIFEEAELLKSLGIRLPASIKIGAELKRRGILEKAAMTEEELIEALKNRF